MPTAEAHIPSDRPSRYLVQLCKHAAAMGDRHGLRMHGGESQQDVRLQAEWTDSRGVLSFIPWGRCTLIAEASALNLRVDAGDETGLRKIQDVLAKDLGRMAHRDAVTVMWEPVQS